MKRLSLFACVLIGVMTFTHSLQAITLEAASLGELSAESNIIVEGYVAESHSYWNDTQRQIFTDTGFDVTKVLKGGEIGKSITIHELGGTVGQTSMEIDGVQRLQRNQRLILFLQKIPNSDQYMIHSFTLGKFYIVQDSTGATIVQSAIEGTIVVPSQSRAAHAETQPLKQKPYDQFITDLHSVLKSQQAGGEE